MIYNVIPIKAAASNKRKLAEDTFNAAVAAEVERRVRVLAEPPDPSEEGDDEREYTPPPAPVLGPLFVLLLLCCRSCSGFCSCSCYCSCYYGYYHCYCYCYCSGY